MPELLVQRVLVGEEAAETRSDGASPSGARTADTREGGPERSPSLLEAPQPDERLDEVLLRRQVAVVEAEHRQVAAGLLEVRERVLRPAQRELEQAERGPRLLADDGEAVPRGELVDLGHVRAARL